MISSLIVFQVNSLQRVELFILAQQEAQRAAFLVERAIQERQQKVVQAEGEAKAATLISFSYCMMVSRRQGVTFC